MPLTPSLEHYSVRALNLLARILSGRDARVVLSRRLQAPLVVAFESTTILLDPARTNLYDLALEARLLPFRPQWRERCISRDRPAGAAARKWLRQAHASLRRDYPRIHHLPGRFLPGADSSGVQLVWKSVPWRPLTETDLEGPLGLTAAPGVETIGTEEDYAWIRHALHSGSVAQEEVPELPVVTFPLTLSFSQEYGPRIEVLEEQIRQNGHLVRGLAQCYHRKSETLQELLPFGRRKTSGTKLDTTRLVDLLLSRRTGITPRLFRRKRRDFQPVFDPRQHLVVMGLDLNLLRRGSFEDPAFSHRFVGCMIRTYQTLEVDFAMLGFADHLLELPDGRRAYVHVPITLKEVDEPFDGLFWNRLAHVLEHPPRLPGEPACYHPLLLRSIARLFDRVSRERQHSYRAILFGARLSMPRGCAEFWTAYFLTRTANALDEQIRALRARLEGTLDTLASFVPAELKAHARRGGAVAAMY